MNKTIIAAIVFILPISSYAYADEGSARKFSCSCSESSASDCIQADISGGTTSVECAPSKDLCDSFELVLDFSKNEVTLCAEPYFPCAQSSSTIDLVGQNTYYAEGTNANGDGDYQITFDSYQSRLHALVSGQLSEFYGSVNGSCVVSQ